MIGLVGKKVGMTCIFHKNGISTPITVIEVKKNYITQIKNITTDSYNAIQVTTGVKKKKKILKTEVGHFSKSGVLVGSGLWEFRVSSNEQFKLGQILDVTLFNTIKKVDISGISKGKGFSGTVKRWNFSMQDATHGNSLSHRAPGSIGQNQTPGRVFKGKKMSGHLGNKRVTIQNLKVMKIDIVNDLMFIKGSVPGPNGRNVIIRPAIKI
ncbi:50S ribosomal protein L3 [Buchnera aphidicola]|uniref:Large ribosomal subunit protein uL3 n=1 Tax=Buchnera aphidicola (Sarucallis kahawaluokalani) TaxID=1241878 RepID=A0A4D6YJI4_9GAMM|nr:50S ribosomal protein L3 [Buchnera aphidicola]QCI26134.1 50S ribosomal protein L3 [Buchnera aphidicola (Sarucallis kahawaluokalani)]